MKRPLVVIVGIAAGLLLVAAAGASAHTALQFVNGGIHAGSILTDEASAPQGESPEPSESPEASPTAEPSESPESETADNDQGEDNDDQGEDTTGTSTGQHSESDSETSTSGSGGKDD